MKHLVYIIFTTFFLLFSCAKQRPKDVLSESDAVDLFTEVSLVDAYLHTLPMDSGRRVLPVLYDNLFRQFGIDSNQFKLNVDYYYGNPQLTEKIYGIVSEKLMEYEKSYRIEDSIRNVFLQDSIRYISNLQKLHQERIDLTMHYAKDTTSYSYKTLGLRFFDRNNLQLNVYGIQIPAIVEEAKLLTETTNAEPESVVVEEEAVLDTIAVSKVQQKERLKSVRDSIIQKRREPGSKPKKLKIKEEVQ